MFAPLLKKFFGSKNERDVKRLGKVVQATNALESQIASLSDEQLRAKTEEFKQRVAKGESLDALIDRKSTRLNSSHSGESRMPSSA